MVKRKGQIMIQAIRWSKAFFLWWRKRKKTTPLPQVTVKLYHTIVFSTRHAGKQTRFSHYSINMATVTKNRKYGKIAGFG
jgi:hypothetical protein